MEVQPKRGNSSIWQRLLKVRAVAEQHMFWIMGRGDIDVSRDRWLIVDPHVASDMQVHSLFTSNIYPNESLVRTHLENDAYKEIIDKGIVFNAESDHVCWTLTSPGGFSLTSAWELTKKRRIFI